MARPKKPFDAESRRTIVGEYLQGYGLAVIAKSYGTSHPVIRRVLVEVGVEIRGRGRPAVSVV